MEYAEKMLAIEKKLETNAYKLETAKSRVSALEVERQKLELSRKELILNDYLPAIEALNMTPSELKELLDGYINTNDSDREVTAYE